MRTRTANAKGLAILPLFLVMQAAFAIDPGFAQGTLYAAGVSIPLVHAYSHEHDNAEGLLDRPRELRILLADREIPQEALRGIDIRDLLEIAREGRVRGLLLQLDPDGGKQVALTVLDAPADPKQPFLKQMATAKAVMKKLIVAPNRVTGEAAQNEDGGALRYDVRFSAPLFYELRVIADLKGLAARQSEPAAVLHKKAQALVRGDLEAVRRLSTARANKKLDGLISSTDGTTESIFPKVGTDLEEALKNLRRVVVRGDRAVVIFDDKVWAMLKRENDQWRSDD